MSLISLAIDRGATNEWGQTRYTLVLGSTRVDDYWLPEDLSDDMAALRVLCRFVSRVAATGAKA